MTRIHSLTSQLWCHKAATVVKPIARLVACGQSPYGSGRMRPGGLSIAILVQAVRPGTSLNPRASSVGYGSGVAAPL